MSNMSYCRWQNTLVDLYDCHGALHDKLSEDEAHARRRLLMTAAEMLNEIGVELNMDDVEGHVNALGSDNSD